ncbi:hypothetical protein [Geodermatophilus sp. URMC 64]
MGHPLTTRTLARTVVIGAFVVALAVAGRPGWLATLLGVLLVGVWAAPYLLVSNRRRPVRVVAEPREAGPTG